MTHTSDPASSVTEGVRVQAGAFLTLHYRLSGPTGDIVNTFGGQPSTLTLGMGELAPALEEKLIGLAEGERARFDLPAGAAFSERNPSSEHIAMFLFHSLKEPLHSDRYDLFSVEVRETDTSGVIYYGD